MTGDSLLLLAHQLAADGVPSLRYDKLFSGRTGGGRYAADPSAATVATFSQEAAAALRFLVNRASVRQYWTWLIRPTGLLLITVLGLSVFATAISLARRLRAG